MKINFEDLIQFSKLTKKLVSSDLLPFKHRDVFKNPKGYSTGTKRCMI